MAIKWKNPQNGGCTYFVRDGWTYFIYDGFIGNSREISNYWHIEKRKIIEPNRKVFKSYAEMLLNLFGASEKKETNAYWAIRSKTDYSGFSDEVRKYEQDGRKYAIDLHSKEVWEYAIPERVSPDFRTVDEVKQWAEECLIENTLF